MALSRTHTADKAQQSLYETTFNFTWWYHNYDMHYLKALYREGQDLKNDTETQQFPQWAAIWQLWKKKTPSLTETSGTRLNVGDFCLDRWVRLHLSGYLSRLGENPLGWWYTTFSPASVMSVLHLVFENYSMEQISSHLLSSFSAERQRQGLILMRLLCY